MDGSRGLPRRTNPQRGIKLQISLGGTTDSKVNEQKKDDCIRNRPQTVEKAQTFLDFFDSLKLVFTSLFF